MRKLTAFLSVTLDGVMQAPASPDEDRRGGFEYGGWATAYSDETTMARASGGPGELLVGRRTYQDFAAAWSQAPADNPFTAIMNESRKYVVSRSLTEPLEWNNSVLLDGVESVRRLKADGDDALTLLGSGTLFRSLVAAGLVDALTLLIHPLVLGTGIRLFDSAAHTALTLVDSVTSGTGVIMAEYRPAP